MIEYVLRKHINEIIDNLDMSNEDLRKRYKWFKLEISNEFKKNSSGEYKTDEHKIIVYQTDNHINANEVCTILHELAHHCDLCNRGTINHQKEFYEMYRKLIYSALDLKKITKEEMVEMNYSNSDYRKVQKILDEYVEKSPRIKINDKNVADLHIYNCYEYKDILRRMGYHWNQRNKSWYKTIEITEIEMEVETLQSFGIKEYELADPNKIKLLREDDNL